MNVLIKGMQIPKNCSDCPLNYDMMSCRITGTRWWSYTMVLLNFDCDDERLYDCPLVELPEHHGDLVDVNEIRWDDHYDSDGNLSQYKIAYSDEMPDPVIKEEELSNECTN